MSAPVRDHPKTVSGYCSIRPASLRGNCCRIAATLVDRVPARNFGYVTTVPPQSSHYQAGSLVGNWSQPMAGESTTRKDSLRVEKLSLLVLTLCIVVLVWLLVARPF